MESIAVLKMEERDNVAVAVRALQKGCEAAEGLIARTDIPVGHKIALADIDEGGAIVRYGVTLGYALRPVARGEWIHEDLLRLPPPPGLDDMPYGTQIAQGLPEPPVSTFDGYANAHGEYAGTRNILAIHTTVQCVAGVLNAAVARIREKILPYYPHVDAVVPINHAYGCGVAIDAPEAKTPIRALRNLLLHPNFGAEVMAVALGCEKFTPQMLLGDAFLSPDNLIVLQEIEGFEAMISAICAMAEKKLKRLNERRREPLPLSKLIIGMQCGGSDAFSGVTCNPAAGYCSDMLVRGGATVLFSEVTEVRDGAHLLAARCANAHTRDRLAEEMRWYDEYLRAGGVGRDANPTPGNKEGGLSNIVEKAMGSIAKSGGAPISEVLSSGERPTLRGLIYAATPASDIVCGAMQLASGIALQIFMTGRGTPYSLAAAPVVKVSSQTALKRRWDDLIDVDAGVILTGGGSIQSVGTELFHAVIGIAGGKRPSCAEKWGLANDLCIFNPAPIT